jgi:hypothetical protein
MEMKRLKLTRIERRRMGRERRRWCRSRGREVTLHPCHDALDSIEGAQGLAPPLLAVEGRPKTIAPGVGAWTAVRVPIGWCPRGLPLYLLVSVLRPGGSLVVIDHRRIEPGGHKATVVRPMLVPCRVDTSHAGV